MGRWVGVAETAIDLMAYYILAPSGKVVVRKDVWALTADERASPEVQANIKELDDSIRSKIGDRLDDDVIEDELLEDLPVAPLDLFEDDDEAIEPYDPEAAKPQADDYTPDI